MEDFLKQLGETTSGATVIESIAAILLSFMLTVVISQIYKRTYQGPCYSQTFVHTIIIMGVVVSVIMTVIGSNMAAAFGLVGAFSIIRFRSAMGDPKDIAFIFFGMVAGIACGLGFYLLATVFTFVLCFLILMLYKINYGQHGGEEKYLKITIPETMNYEGVFDDIFDQHLEYYTLKNVETTSLGTMIQFEYLIKGKKRMSTKQLMDDIRARNANLKVSINFPD